MWYSSLNAIIKLNIITIIITITIRIISTITELPVGAVFFIQLGDKKS
jgi:hypothetical protein